mmetsp:Transcript_30891/g.65718  ORF Transcript_30891/g.65718 Transcript_30891/m.65718 type:complete len:214 (+) Transcript_30891:208-849(+)
MHVLQQLLGKLHCDVALFSIMALDMENEWPCLLVRPRVGASTSQLHPSSRALGCDVPHVLATRPDQLPDNSEILSVIETNWNLPVLRPTSRSPRCGSRSTGTPRCTGRCSAGTARPATLPWLPAARRGEPPGSPPLTSSNSARTALLSLHAELRDDPLRSLRVQGLAATAIVLAVRRIAFGARRRTVCRGALFLRPALLVASASGLRLLGRAS